MDMAKDSPFNEKAKLLRRVMTTIPFPHLLQDRVKHNEEADSIRFSAKEVRAILCLFLCCCVFFFHFLKRRISLFHNFVSDHLFICEYRFVPNLESKIANQLRISSPSSSLPKHLSSEATQS